MSSLREFRDPRKRASFRARAASSVAALTALVLSPAAALADGHPASTSAVRGGDVPLEVVRPSPRGTQTYHEVRPGEHLSGIAAAYGLGEVDGWRRLFDANPRIRHPDQLEPGDRVRIPSDSEELVARALPAGALAPSRGAAPTTGRGAASGTVWDRLARCESGGNWHINTGNGYYGGLQFSLGSWQAVGGTGYPHEHSRGTQIAMAQRLLAVQGWGAWPSCSRRLGLR